MGLTHIALFWAMQMRRKNEAIHKEGKDSRNERMRAAKRRSVVEALSVGLVL